MDTAQETQGTVKDTVRKKEEYCYEKEAGNNKHHPGKPREQTAEQHQGDPD